MWFRVDDKFPFHRKTIRAGNAAVGLWVRAGSWLRSQEAEDDTREPGLITLAELKTMGTQAEVNRLVAAGFFVACKHDGHKAVRFHDWAEWQPSLEDLEAKRESWAVRKRRSRLHAAGDHTMCLPRYCHDAPPYDDTEPHREDD